MVYSVDWWRRALSLQGSGRIHVAAIVCLSCVFHRGGEGCDERLQYSKGENHCLDCNIVLFFSNSHWTSTRSMWVSLVTRSPILFPRSVLSKVFWRDFVREFQFLRFQPLSSLRVTTPSLWFLLCPKVVQTVLRTQLHCWKCFVSSVVSTTSRRLWECGDDSSVWF